MEVLAKAISASKPIALQSSLGVSAATVIPVQRSPGCVAFGLESDPDNYVRIWPDRVDLKGARNGPWTEFRIVPDGDGAVHLQGVRASSWLHVADGKFSASKEQQPLVLKSQVDVKEGDVVKLSLSNSMSVSLPFPMKILHTFNAQCKKKHVLLATFRQTLPAHFSKFGDNFACSPNRLFHQNGGAGMWAQWDMDSNASGTTFKNIGHGKYLALDQKGNPLLSEDPVLFSVTHCESESKPAAESVQAPKLDKVASSKPAAESVQAPKLDKVVTKSIQPSPQNPLTKALPPVSHDALTKEDIAHFRKNGYIVLRGAVAPELIRDAVHSINHQLGTPRNWRFDNSKPDDPGRIALRLPKTEGEVGGKVLTKSPRFWSALNILLGEGNVNAVKNGVQIALRFPTNPAMGHNVPDVKPGTQYHIDGQDREDLSHFTLLCGVALSDQSKPNCGNLHVYPGSHLNKDMTTYYVQTLKKSKGEKNGKDYQKPHLGQSTQVLLKPGDIVIAHNLLAHAIGTNTNENIRYQLYYRIEHKDHANLAGRIVDDPWVEFAI